MGQIPTMKVIRKTDGKNIIINAVDFEKDKHEEPVTVKPKPNRKTRTYKKARPRNE